jgi:hypothetical protein
LEANKNHQDAVTVDQKKSDDATKAEVKRTRELLESARDALTPKINAIEDQRIAVKGLEGMVDIESQQVKIAQDALDQATHRVRAATNATAFLNASGGRSVLINDKIASTVENIVKVVLEESGRGEMCITLSNQLESMLQKKEDTEKIVAALKTLSCLAAVQEKAAATEDPEVRKELKKVLPQLL